MPELSIREKAVRVLVARLEAMEPPDYWFGPPRVERDNWDEGWAPSTPAACLNEVQESAEIQNAQGQYEVTLELSAELVVDYAGADPQGTRNAMLSDLKRALLNEFSITDAVSISETIGLDYVGARDASDANGSRLLVQMFFQMIFRHSLYDDTRFQTPY